ncbi:MAG: glycosyltransferase family 2 protein [Methylococcales bacterium]|nr:glycosyltransferase family 2 protein [Methylococcaceae bacterium]
MERHRIAIVIPALNESATICQVVEAVNLYGVPIVVDDGSRDDTAKLAKSAGAVVVSHEHNRGYDEALNTGFNKALELGSELIITVDGDGQHTPSLLQDFIDQIDAGADIVIGVRHKRQRFAEHLFAGFTMLCFGIKDPLCGMKAYRTEIYTALGHFDSYGSIGTELMMFAALNGYRISQLKFVTRERTGQSRFGQVLEGNYKICRALWRTLLRYLAYRIQPKSKVL